MLCCDKHDASLISKIGTEIASPQSIQQGFVETGLTDILIPAYLRLSLLRIEIDSLCSTLLELNNCSQTLV